MEARRESLWPEGAHDEAEEHDVFFLTNIDERQNPSVNSIGFVLLQPFVCLFVYFTVTVLLFIPNVLKRELKLGPYIVSLSFDAQPWI